jgi:hypothetical protein
MFEGLKVYIAGPITGTDDYKERFEAAEKHLRNLGAKPMHSANLPQGFTHSEYICICRAMIDVCEAVYFLENYMDSEGALMEFTYAAGRKKRLFYQGLDPAWIFDDAVAGLENRILYGESNVEPVGIIQEETDAQDKEKIFKIKNQCFEIIERNRLYFENGYGTYYNYNKVIELLEEIKTELDHARTPRPDNIPEDMAWSETFYDGEDPDPFVFDGSMSPEDFDKFQGKILAYMDGQANQGQ